MKNFNMTEAGTFDYDRCITQLKELGEKKRIDYPQYSFQKVFDAKGVFCGWRAQCTVRGYGMTCGLGTRKKSAKRACSYGMLHNIMEF